MLEKKKECDPNGKNLRPDISIYNAEEVDSGDDRNRTLVMDVQVTDPIPGSQGGILKDPPARTAGTPEVQADYAYADKNRKYKNVSHQNGLSFSPLIFESTGRMHKSTVAILRSFAKLAEEPLRIPKAVLYGYFIRRISCCLQRSIARAILTRVSAIKRRVSKATRNSYYKS